jgi:hypothetical protein
MAEHRWNVTSNGDGMTMRDESAKRTAGGQTDSADSTVDAIEQKVLAFAEQLGRIVGTVQAKTEGWLDRDALNAQLSTVRDSATDLLQQLGGKGRTATTDGRRSAASKASKASKSTKASGGKATVASKARASATSATRAKSGGTGRSGGAVDAPGKQHRKPMPSESAATGQPRGGGSRIAKLKMANENRIMRRRG